MIEQAQKAKAASVRLGATTEQLKNKALANIISQLEQEKDRILAANQRDMDRAKRENLDPTLQKRLLFDAAKLESVVKGLQGLLKLEDPVGKKIFTTELDTGLVLSKVSCPIGVIGVIFESRPEALVQIAGLCLKSGNAVLLKGGKEAAKTNKVLADIIRTATGQVGIDQNWLYNIETREEVGAMLELDQYIDLIIPRGSNQFVQYILQHSKIPVLGHADGICHGYVHADADCAMAIRVIVDAKTDYVAACNALETLLVNRQIAKRLLPDLKRALDQKQVQIRGCAETAAIIDCSLAAEQDWQTEYLDYILSIKLVEDLAEAIEHINYYGSGHTDMILTADSQVADTFMNLVDSANVYHNCSTRFADGFRYGFGAEVGISTNKIHARGPVGLDGLVIYKYKLSGHGDIVDDYSKNKKQFKHAR